MSFPVLLIAYAVKALLIVPVHLPLVLEAPSLFRSHSAPLFTSAV